MRTMLILALCGVAAVTAHVTGDKPDAAPAVHLRVCATEDSDNCAWDASTQGNGQGTSFVSINGQRYYATTPHQLQVCARAAFLADDYAHTHSKPVGYRAAIEACAAEVGGF